MPNEDDDKYLGIPDFLKRAPTPANLAPGDIQRPIVTADGNTTDAETAPSPESPQPKPFENFRVDPAEIETKIQVEADRRWRNWQPSREHLTRPRKSFFLREVRKEFYP